MSNTTEKLREWAMKMEYKGTIPDDFSHVVNASTATIWEQIINRCKPREEVQQIRRNILMQLLKAKTNNNSSALSVTALEYPNKELEVWEKKQKLLKHVADKRSQVLKAKQELKRLQDKNNLLKVNLQVNINSKVDEAEKKVYLHKQKQKLLKNGINSAEKQLDSITSLNKVIDTDVKKPISVSDIEKVAGSIQWNADVCKICTNPLIEKLYANYNVIDVIRSQEEAFYDDLQQCNEQQKALNRNFEEEYAAICDVNLSKLHGEHIKQVFMNISQKKLLEKLLDELSNREFQACEKLQDVYGNENMQQMISQELNALEEETMYNAYKQEIIDLKKPVISTCDNNQTLKDIKHDKRLLSRAQRTLKTKIQAASTQWERIMNIEKHLQEHFHESKSLLQWLMNSSTGIDHMAQRLASRVFTKEMQSFEIFNLEYNKRLYYVNDNTSAMFYRDTFDSRACFINLEDQILQRVVSILNIPVCGTSVDIIQYFDDKRRRYEQLLGTATTFKCDLRRNQSYNLQELQEAKKKCNLLMDKEKLNAPTSSLNLLKKNMDLWMEMPLAKYVPNDIKYKGRSYKDFENDFMLYYTQLE